MYIIKKANFTLTPQGVCKVDGPYVYLKMSFDTFDKAKEGLKELFETCDEDPVKHWTMKSKNWENKHHSSFVLFGNTEEESGVIYKIASA